MDGIIIVDKSVGWTSHDVVAKLRGAMKIKRVGHGGTLDPLATGVLPVLVGRATRAADFLTNAKKEYIAGLSLGLVTDTQDITGNVISSCEVSVTENELTDVLSGFLGSLRQIPPMHSAVRHNGKKLYELARRGIEVERPERDIFVSEIEILESHGSEFTLRMACSKGTYIRTLCHDIGAALGCGGTMSSLRRTAAGSFTIDMAHTLDEILYALSSGDFYDVCLDNNPGVIPVDSIFSQYPAAALCEEETRKCRNGALHTVSGKPDGRYRFYGSDNEFLMLGDIIGGSVTMIKGFYSNNV